MVPRQLRPVSRRTALRGALVFGLGGASTGCTPEPKAGQDATVGGELRLGALSGVGAPASDPHGELSSPFDWYRMAAIYDVLAVPGKDGAVVPRLAESWGPDDTGTRWRFRLRAEAAFSDGSRVRAEDVLYSLRRAKRPEAVDRLAAVDADRSFAEDDRTVVLATRNPEPDLPRTVSMLFVVPAGTETFDDPVGAGPFRQVVLRGQEAWLLSSDTWWGTTRGIDQINLRGYPDARGLETALTSGAVEAAFDLEPAAALLAEREHGCTVSHTPDVRTFGVLMRADRAPFDRPQVRKAVKLALDRKVLVDKVLVGTGRLGNDVPTPTDPSFPADLAPPATDLVRARTLLDEAGFPDGFPVVLHTTDSRAAMVGSANVIAEQLAEIGIEVRVTLHSPETYWSHVYDTEPFVVTCRSGAQFAEWSQLATGAWPDPAFADELASARALTDRHARRTAYTELQRMVASDGTEAVWGFADALDVARPHVRDLPTGTGLARMMLDGVWLAR